MGCGSRHPDGRRDGALRLPDRGPRGPAELPPGRARRRPGAREAAGAGGSRRPRGDRRAPGRPFRAAAARHLERADRDRAELRQRAPGRPGARPVREAPSAELLGVRRVPHLHPRRRAARAADQGGGCRPHHLRGPLARRRPGRPRAAGGCRPAPRVNASPFERDKDDVRLPLVTRRARETGTIVAYVNIVGGQDDLVFDGDSVVVDGQGTILARAPQFREHLLVVDVEPAGANDVPLPEDVERVEVAARPDADAPAPAPAPAPDIAVPPDGREQLWNALVLGLRDYVEKNRFPSVVLGLSGGIDSSVCAALAADAIGADRVYGVSIAQPLQLRALALGRRRPRRADRPALLDPGDRRPGRPGRGAAAADRDGRRERAGAHPGHHPDGRVEHARPPRAHDGQQDGAVGRLLDDLRRLRRRLRPDQGRAEDAGLGAGALAQRVRALARRDRADPGELDREAPQCRVAPRSDRPGHPAAVRAARRDPGEVHHRAAGPRRHRRARLRPGDGRLRDPAGRRRGVEAPAGRDRPEDLRMAFGRDRRLPITYRHA